MTRALWDQWRADWERMEAIADRRGWQVTPLSVAPPASGVALRNVETRHGLVFPPQLREVLTSRSAHVAFGWYIPPHLHPLDKQNLPTMSANRMAIWDIRHIDEDAIPNFLGWKEALKNEDQTESPNTPDMWEHQFPFYSLVNGDMLTIDMSDEKGAQPVRYFSHEVGPLHGMALAPDFFTFITEMSKLGFAGTEWASWGGFGTWNEEAKTFYIRADSPGGQAWLAWLAKDTKEPETDVPPASIVEETIVERQLLDAARAKDTAGVAIALAAGARPDVVPNADWLVDNMSWNDEFCTALNYAVQTNNLDLAETLLKAGATLDTRRLVMADAAQFSSLATLRWLIGKGARVNGWKDDRYWPLHHIVVNRTRVTAPTRGDLEKRLRSEDRTDKPIAEMSEIDRLMRESREKLLQAQLLRWIDRPTYLAMLKTLLSAGAEVDARWDNGITMLGWAEDDDAAVLIEAGADVNVRDIHGSTPLHRARTPGKIRLLVAHGADINALEEPPDASEPRGSTPLQSALLLSSLGGMALVDTFLELKADPRKKDGLGRSTLCFCVNVESFRRIEALGLDPKELQPGGRTLLHSLLQMTSIRAAWPGEVAMLDLLLSLGLPINATDDSGQTILHIAAERIATPDDMKLLLDRGADKTIVDKNGKRPKDLVAPSLTEIRALLS